MSDNPSASIDAEYGSRCLGRFRIPSEYVRLYPDHVQKLMAECVVVRCELRHDTDAFEYVAISRHFEHVEPWAMPPFYVAQFEEVKLEESETVVPVFTGFTRGEETAFL